MLRRGRWKGREIKGWIVGCGLWRVRGRGGKSDYGLGD